MSGQIFISYRRDDASFPAGRLYDRLLAHFPKNQIFMDVDNLDPGVDFFEAIETSVGSCDVLIAVIGKRWLLSSDEEGKPRLDNTDDFVRLEIATALKRNIRVIPVLVDGALMPRSSDLPDDLKLLVRRNALEVSHNRFNADLGRLIAAIERVLEKADAERKQREEQVRVEAEQFQREESERQEVQRREGVDRGRLEASSWQNEATERLEKERLETEQREKKRLEAAARQQKEEERLKAAQHDRDRLEAEHRESLRAGRQAGEERERLEHESQSQPSSPVKPPTVPVGRNWRKESVEADNRFLAIATVLVVGGLIYLAMRASQSPLPQRTPIAAVTPSPEITATPAADRRVLVTQGAALIASPSTSATPTKEELARIALDKATKDDPWVNSLGMKFVPVAGTQVLFSVWDTRVQDFETFVKSTDYDATGGMYSLGKDGYKQRGATWKEPGFSQGPNHPVVGVSWDDAKEFCKWLTKRERSAGDLPEDREYRLPTDEEWSAAVGLKNEVGSTPSCIRGTSRRSGTKAGHHLLELAITAGRRRGLETKQKIGESLKAITTAIHGLARWEALRQILMVCTIWEATCGNCARIGTILKRNTVCCAVRRGAISTPTGCLLRFAAPAALIFVSIVSGFVVL